MMGKSNLILTTSPPSQPTKNPCGTTSLPRRLRPLYGRKRYYHTVKERDSETGLHYYGARYLDSKTGRWISGDPAVGEYVPSAPINDEARKRNGNLPGMGGVFNYVNLHVYHYAGNSPVNLVDPDGKTPKSYKLAENRYMFHASTSTLDGAVEAAFTGAFPIPFLGTPIANGINKAFGFQNIDTENMYSTLTNIASNLSDSASTIATVAKLIGKASDLTKSIGKVAGNISTALAMIDIGFELSKSDAVGMDKMISNILGNELQASSHEGVAALYTYAKSEMIKLRSEGAFSYTTDKTGMITSSRYKPSAFDNLRQELRILKATMEE